MGDMTKGDLVRLLEQADRSKAVYEALQAANIAGKSASKRVDLDILNENARQAWLRDHMAYVRAREAFCAPPTGNE